MTSLIAIFFFLFGLIIGSFLNVVIFRMNTARSLGGRSACISCRNILCWYELIPLFSFLALGGRCRNCKTHIGIQYPLVELSTGIIFTLLFLKFQDIFFISTPSFLITYVYYATQFSLLMVIATYDLKHKIIPDTLSLLFGIFSFAGLFFFSASFSSSLVSFHIPNLLEFLSGLLIASPFAFFWFVSRGAWMGLGDAKLALGLGWFLGLSLALSGLVIAFWSGAIIGVILVLCSKKNMKSEIPFAPFLIFGVVIAFFLNLHIFTF